MCVHDCSLISHGCSAAESCVGCRKPVHGFSGGLGFLQTWTRVALLFESIILTSHLSESGKKISRIHPQCSLRTVGMLKAELFLSFNLPG